MRKTAKILQRMNNRSQFFFVPCIFFYLLAGCHKKKSLLETSSLTVFDENAALLNNAHEMVRQSDIPIPPTYAPIKKCTLSENSSLSQSHLVYQGLLSLAQTKLFYQEELERLGWDIADLSSNDETLLCCTSINKQCAISLRPESCKKTIMHVFIKNSHSNECDLS